LELSHSTAHALEKRRAEKLQRMAHTLYESVQVALVREHEADTWCT